MTGVLDSLLHVPGPVVLATVAALVFGEAAVFLGFVFPGETAVLLGGFLASTGRLNVVLLGVVVVAAAIVGDSVGYEVGKRLGPRLLRTRLFRRHQTRVDRARSFLDGRGASAIFVGRFTAFLRAVTPGLAGLSGMRYRRFLAWNAAGGRRLGPRLRGRPGTSRAAPTSGWRATSARAGRRPPRRSWWSRSSRGGSPAGVRGNPRTTYRRSGARLLRMDC